MDEIIHRLDECFDEDGQKVAIKYLNKCLTKLLESNLKDFEKSLQQQNIPKKCIQRECAWRMAMLGLITEEEARKRMDNCK